MEGMTDLIDVENFLHSWRISNEKIKLSKDRITDLENLRIYPGGGGFEERIQGGSHLQRYEKYAEIDERIEKELAKVEEETAKCKRVEETLASFGEEYKNYGIILQYAFTTELTIDQILERINYSRAWYYAHMTNAKVSFKEWFSAKNEQIPLNV